MAFLDHALALGADKIATGHYAVNERRAGENRLLKGKDLNKDQSYFLCRLTQPQLRQSLFPLGALKKPQVARVGANSGTGGRTTRKTALAFVSSASVPSRSFSAATCRHGPASSAAWTGKSWASTRGRTSTHWGNGRVWA